jgi:putative ABC transport system permease protein
VALVLIGDRVRVALQTYDGRQDIDVLSIPWRQLVVFVVLAAIVGVLAAVLPARRAAKLDVLRAIRTE